MHRFFLHTICTPGYHSIFQNRYFREIHISMLFNPTAVNKDEQLGWSVAVPQSIQKRQ